MLSHATNKISEATPWGFFLWLLFILVSVTVANAVSLWRKRPRGVKIAGPTILVGKWISTLDFILRASAEIEKAYEKSAEGALFAIPALRQYQVLVSRPQQVKELAASNPNVLSFNAAMRNRLFENQTMYGFTFGEPDLHNSVANRAIKVLLGTHLNTLIPTIKERIVQGIEGQLNQVSTNADGSKTVNLTKFARAVAMQANSQILFGDELASDPSFLTACLRYSWDGGITAEFSRQVPSFIAPMIGRALMAWSGAMRKVGGRVSELIDCRVLAEVQGKAEHFIDVTQFVIRSSRTPQQKSRSRLTQQMVALLFAISHQTPMAMGWALTMLGTHTEYMPLLRDEIRKVEAEHVGSALPLKKLRLMDSFLRETSRLNPLDALNTQRMALQDFTFSDGSHVPAGNLLAVPQHAVLRDAQTYEDPEHFNGHRFYTPDVDVDSTASTKYTDVKWEFPYWGAPNHACPGRWYASDLQKLLLVYVLKNYEFELSNPEVSSKPFVWTTALVPRLGASMTFRRREKAQVGQF